MTRKLKKKNRLKPEFEKPLNGLWSFWVIAFIENVPLYFMEYNLLDLRDSIS